MSGKDSTKIRETPNNLRQSLISILVEELANVSRKIGDIPHDANEDAADAPIWERHWTIRALISATPALTASDFKLKSGVFKEEFERDFEFDCDVPGSARHFVPSLIDDALALLAG